LPALLEKYFDIRKGLSFNKDPAAYGAFPTDPYSHTPSGQGARQPGMTGLVKEEILTRQVELGYTIENGSLVFDFTLLDRDEFLTENALFTYLGVDGGEQQIELPAGSIDYTICQVPVILRTSNENNISVHLSDGSLRQVEGHTLDAAHSRHIFMRDGVVHSLLVNIAAA